MAYASFRQRRAPSPNNLLDLPAELLVDILSNLQAKEILQSKQICKHLRDVVNHNQCSLVVGRQEKLISKLKDQISDYLGDGTDDLLDHLLRFTRHRGLPIEQPTVYPRSVVGKYGNELNTDLIDFTKAWLFHRVPKQWRCTLNVQDDYNLPWGPTFELQNDTLGVAHLLMDQFELVLLPQRSAKWSDIAGVRNYRNWYAIKWLTRWDRVLAIEHGIKEDDADGWFTRISEQKVSPFQPDQMLDGPRLLDDKRLRISGGKRIRLMRPSSRLGGQPGIPEVDSWALNHILQVPVLEQDGMFGYCVETRWASLQIGKMLRGIDVGAVVRTAVLEEMSLI